MTPDILKEHAAGIPSQFDSIVTDPLARAVDFAASELHDLAFNELPEHRGAVQDLIVALKHIDRSLDRLTAAVERATVRL